MELKDGRLQDDPTWCIPAAIENVLRHYGETGWNQRRLVRAWTDWKQGTPSFDLGSPAQFLPTTELGGRFSFSFSSCGLDEAKRILAERSRRQSLTIVSCAVPNMPGCAHMRIVTDMCDDGVTTFDPADACHRRWTWNDFAPLLGSTEREVHMLLISPAAVCKGNPAPEDRR